MKILKNYAPPSPQQMEELKKYLGFSGRQMAGVAGLSGSNQWRKYTGGEKPREMSAHVLFFMAAQLELDDERLAAIARRMREIGAEVELDSWDHAEHD